MGKTTTSRVKKFRREQVSPEVNRLIGKCRRLWSTFNSRGLEVRYETGVLLNKIFGDPAARQVHGGKVLKRVAKELQISRSELTRMKQFACQFGSLAVFCEQHPDCGTWSAVKKILSGSAPNPDEPLPDTTAKSAMSGLVMCLNRLNKKFRATEFCGDEAELEQLRTTLNELIELAKSRLDQGLQLAHV
jgi:hypothetical protein